MDKAPPSGIYCAADPLVEVLGAGAADTPLDAADSLAGLAASLVPGVPLNPAELLITPLLPELMGSLLVSSTFLHAVVATADAGINRINKVLLCF